MCVKLNLSWAYVFEWERDKGETNVLLSCVSRVLSCVLNNFFLHCLFERLAFCVWAIGVENDKEWVKEWEG